MSRLLVPLAVVLLLPGCGGETPLELGPPPRVAEDLVPPTILGAEFSFTPYSGEEAKKVFAEAEENALVADGRIWELRQRDTLVGVLQISTVKPRVDLSKKEHRDFILAVLAGGVKRIEIDGVAVHFTETADQLRGLWFGADFYEVLTLKRTKLDAEEILAALIGYQVRHPAWRPVSDEAAASAR